MTTFTNISNSTVVAGHAATPPQIARLFFDDEQLREIIMTAVIQQITSIDIERMGMLFEQLGRINEAIEKRMKEFREQIDQAKLMREDGSSL